MKIAVLGGGAWGTALAIYLAHDHEIAFWCRESDVLDDIAEIHENRRFLKGFPIPENVVPIATIPQAIQNADLILIATPTAGLRPTLEILKAENVSAPILWACKGFEAKTSLLPHQVLKEVLGDYPAAVLAGPSFAQEVAAGEPCAVSMAANRPNLARELSLKLHRPSFRIYANDDLIGVEVGAATKNVLAIATGICDGLKMGNNTRAALVTRGLGNCAVGRGVGRSARYFYGIVRHWGRFIDLHRRFVAQSASGFKTRARRAATRNFVQNESRGRGRLHRAGSGKISRKTPN